MLNPKFCPSSRVLASDHKTYIITLLPNLVAPTCQYTSRSYTVTWLLITAYNTSCIYINILWLSNCTSMMVRRRGGDLHESSFNKNSLAAAFNGSPALATKNSSDDRTPRGTTGRSQLSGNHECRYLAPSTTRTCPIAPGEVASAWSISPCRYQVEPAKAPFDLPPRYGPS